MTDEKLELIAIRLRLWASKITSGRYGKDQTQYFQGKIDGTWQILDNILSDEEIKKLEALTGDTL